MSFRDIARRWLVANALAIVATAACGWIGFGLQTLAGLESGEAGFAARAASAASNAAVFVVRFAAFAVLTGPVLRLVVPALSQRSWLTAHLVIGVTYAVAAILPLFGGRDEAGSGAWRDSYPGFVIPLVLLAAAFGAVVGLITAAVQVVVLRTVATGTRMWRLMSAASGSLEFLTILAVAWFFLSGQPVMDEIVIESASALAGLVTAVVMLPALRRLKPREG